MERFYYLALDLLSIAFPLAASFEPRIAFWSKRRGLFTGMVVMLAVFIIWDIIFTVNGVWGFSDRYTLGIDVVRLPLEEWLFFIAIPYSCVYLYEVMRYAIRKDVLARIAVPLSIAWMLVLLVVGVLTIDRMYTAVTFLSTAALLAVHVFVLKSPWLGRFFLGYAVSLIPFFIVNGILTGWLLPEPIVWYNDAENLGIRLNTIPIEDSQYLLFFLLLTITFYERSLKRAHGDLPPNDHR
ncbi:MAG: lycopene cyclase domain-containing protein [Flavobacteriales bacterium]|nr:lycopene cyclase domain-containing protein [Flavobacteriales bacterium]